MSKRSSGLAGPCASDDLQVLAAYLDSLLLFRCEVHLPLPFAIIRCATKIADPSFGDSCPP